MNPATPRNQDKRPIVSPQRVLVVDPHPLARLGFAQLIASTTEPLLVVAGETRSRREAQQLIERDPPDLVLTALELGDDDGLDLIAWLRDHHPDVRVLVLSARDAATFGERALRAGALGFIGKDAPLEALLTAIREVLAGRIHAPAALTERVLSVVTGRRARLSDDPFDLLSDRELQVFEHLGSGRSSREIAQVLGLSVKTIATHRANIQAKLGGVSLAELVRRAVLWVESRSAEKANGDKPNGDRAHRPPMGRRQSQSSTPAASAS